MPEVTIIGLGALGTALTGALCEQNIPIKSVFNRSPERAESIASDYDIEMTSTLPSTSNQLASLVFITVSDTAISDIVRHLVDMQEDLSGITFVHCSGNEPADLLDPLGQEGAQIASMHPLQTFTPQSSPADFNGIYFSLHGDQSIFPMLKDIAQQLGAHTLEVTSRQKAHLHAAAVFASNYLVTLLDASTETAATSGLADQKVKEALLPLVQTALKNVEKQAFPDALSGPIKRGDLKTIEDHLALLRSLPALRKLYCALGNKTVALAQSSKYIDKETAAKFKEILRS